MNWKDVVGYEGLYEVSSCGSVRNTKTKSCVKSAKTTDGYVICGLYRCGRRKNARVHRLVVEAFIGAIESGLEVNHKNGIKDDNRVENLESVCHRDNVMHRYYSLGQIVVPVVATNIETGERRKFRSISETREAGFSPSRVKKCLYGQRAKHHGHTFERAVD